MALVNTVLFEAACPNCGRVVEFSFSTEYAASADIADDGRLCGRQYHLGQRMVWWPEGSEAYDLWLPWGRPRPGVFPYQLGAVRCGECGEAACARLEFSELIPERVQLRTIAEWPQDPADPDDPEPSVLSVDYPDVQAMLSKASD